MDLEADASRGANAKRILDDPLFKGAVERVQKDIYDRFCALEPSDLEGLRIQRLRQNALADVVRGLTSVMQTGRLAQEEINRKQTLVQKATERMARGIRAVF